MAVQLTGIDKEFPGARGESVRAVSGVSLEVEAGELVTLLGPSGCGKTTTLRMIAGFELPTRGRITIAGRDVTFAPPYQRNVPMVFQSYALFPHLTVLENATFGLEMRGVRKQAAVAKVQALAASMHLDGLLDRQPHALSGGQQQRVALLRALVLSPEVLLFDEPLSNLDAQMRTSVRGEIRALQKRAGITAIYVTHDQAEAMSISDRVVVMHSGKVAQIGTPSEVYHRPRSRFVATFLGDANFVAGEASGSESGDTLVNTALGALRLAGASPPAGREVMLVVRPEALRLLPEGDGVRARIARATFLGPEISYELQLGDTILMARAVATPAGPMAEGTNVTITVDTAGIHVLPAADA